MSLSDRLREIVRVHLHCNSVTHSETYWLWHAPCALMKAAEILEREKLAR